MPKRALAAILRGLRSILAEPIYGVCSRRVLAAHVGRSPRTVSRWLAGVDIPGAEHARALAGWLNSMHEKIPGWRDLPY